MRPRSETRCFWFEDDGTPLKKSGCPNESHCRFAHPTDENWDRLPKQRTRPFGYESPPPPPSSSRSRSRRSRYRSESRSRSRTPSRRRGKESRSRVRSRSREKDKRGDRMVVDPPRTKSHSSTSKGSVPTTTAPLPDASSSTSMAITNGTSSALPTPPSSSTIMPPIFTKKISERPTPTGPSALRSVSSPMRALDPPAVVSDKNSPPVVLDERVPGLRFVSIKLPSVSTSTAVPPQPVSAPPSQPPPPPPATPGMLAAMPPPRYPLPGVPEGLSIKIPTRVEVPTPTDKRKIWEERIRLFADAYQAKRDLERCEQMYKYASDISQSNLFPTFSEDEKGRYNAELAEVVANRDKVKKAHDDAVDQLIQQGSWPIGPPPSTKADEQEEQERRDILRHVQELNDTAQKMSKILGDIAMKTNPPTLPVPADDDDDDDFYAEDPMDLDDNPAAGTPKVPVADPSGSLPSRKRQRLSEGEDAIRPVVDPDLPTREELEVYRVRLEKLEGKIIDLDNELSQYEDEVRSSFRDEVENRISAHKVEMKQKEKERKEKEKTIREEEMSKVNADAADLENDVNEVGKEVAEVITKIESLKIQLAEETKQRDIMEARVAQVNDRLQGYIQQRESNVRTMQTLEAALKAYLSSVSRPSPPATPSSEAVAPTSAYILSQLQEPILQAIRQHLQPMLAQSRIDTEALMRERNTEIVRKIWPRMELVSRLLANVADKLDRENSLMTPVTPAAPPAPVPTHSLHPVPQSIQRQQQDLANQPPAGYPPWAGSS